VTIAGTLLYKPIIELPDHLTGLISGIVIAEIYQLIMNTKLSKKQKKEKCYQALKAKIVTGLLKPGDTLTEQELMEEFSIGRTPLREILLRIQSAGLIIRVPRGGTIIAPLDIISFMHLMETRIPLELFAGELVPKRISSDQLNNLKTQLHALKNLAYKNGKEYKFARMEIEFHTSIYRATQNPELAKLLEQLHDKCARVWYCLTNGSDDIFFGLNDLCALLDAIAAKDISLIKKIIKRHLNGFITEVGKRINT
jgi:DNA-binding GntR family transcriptional regulator